MTCDPDENDHPYKIDIRIEDDEDHHLKELFEKGLGSLLDDEHFLLLYVPDNGDKMQIVRPASNLLHRRRMIKRINEAKRIPSFYYALSHLWGLTENNRYHWNDINEYVNDEDGQPVKPVSMRPEKRDALLSMLQDHPDSYWWIDVLCARTNTPLDIMGDIYSCCLECIAMIDCEPTLIRNIHTMSYAAKGFEESYFNAGGCPTYDKVYQTKAPQLIKFLCTFFKTQWWQRVWTWQEMALPVGDVRFIAETNTLHLLQTNTITLNQLLGYTKMVRLMWDRGVRDTLHDRDAKAIKLVAKVLDDIYGARKSNKYRISRSKDRFYFLLWSLRDSTRRCMDPADYVYGVLGMLQIKIPRMEDPNAVWRHFLSALDNYMDDDDDDRSGSPSCIDRADIIDICKARNIGHVYKKLIEIYFGFK